MLSTKHLQYRKNRREDDTPKSFRVFLGLITMLLIMIMVAGIAVSIINAECTQNGTTQLFFLSSDNLWRLEINSAGTHQDLLINSRSVIDYDFDYAKNRLAWIDNQGRIFFRHLGNSTQEIVYKFSPISLESKIAYDSASQRFYVNEGDHSKIWTVDPRTKNRTDFFDCDSLLEKLGRDLHCMDDQEKVKKVVLDAKSGLFFVLTEIRQEINNVKNIYSFKMDGTFKKVIVSSKDLVHFDIDRENKRIYWDDSDKKVIVSADYEGNSRKNVVILKKLEPFAVSGNKIFWSYHDLFRGYQIKTCNLCNNVCKRNDIRTIPLDKLREKPYDLKIMQPLNISNRIQK